MSFVLSFGSVGDFIAVIQLLNGVREALCDSTGSSAEYQALIIDLDVFSDILHAVQRAFSSANHFSPSTSLINAHRQAVQSSYELLKDIHKKIRKYQHTLGNGGSGSVMRDSWRKVGWALFKKPELVEMRRKVMDQVEILNILVSIPSREDACQQQEKFITLESSVRELPVSIRDFGQDQHNTLVEVLRCINKLPTALGYTWEGGLGPSQRPVILTDALGQILRLPIELCESWELFDGIMKLYFKQRAGSQYVQRGDYVVTLTSTPTSNIPQTLDKSTWAERVDPGSTINMDMVIQQPYKVSGERLRTLYKTCPNCGCNNNGRRDFDGFTCLRCQTWFVISGRVEIAQPDKSSSSSSWEIISPQVQEESTDCTDISFLRRVRIFKLVRINSSPPRSLKPPYPAIGTAYYTIWRSGDSVVSG
ncbi:hypothetical protein BT96DRAFT_1017253 [Gymnopus androsaceus JB14]|uniref:Ubiquitin-like domain-containing protein n=1 Tax=Gymnopus androsaceus JB14 TaxID=1447944 RepID=A0A6A4I0Q6_9AGAR|nr:hypothetical protein BT96DRAFT_1017253 [Gymnopus androsaceus JB14]